MPLGETAEENEERRIGDCIAVQHPRQVFERRAAEVFRDTRQRDVDDEEIEIRETDADAHDGEHTAGRSCFPLRLRCDLDV